MPLEWIREKPAYWDANKRGIVGDAPEGTFANKDYSSFAEGDALPGDWYRVDEDGVVVGYGWMDITWGDAEILLAVAEAQRGKGVGSFIVEQLTEEVASRGLNYLYNAVADDHPERAQLTAWLEKRGFKGSEGGELLRRRAKSTE